MAIYFKCPKCGQHFMDCFGEYAGDGYEHIEGYVCPDCTIPMEQISESDYRNAPYGLKARDTELKNFGNYRILNQISEERERELCGEEEATWTQIRS